MAQLVPVLSSEAGSCLTSANWLEAGISCGAYYLENLLFKPGVELLNRLSSLADYLNWSGSLILNATTLLMNKNGDFSCKSPFDGQKVTLTQQQLITLIQQLRPTAVLMPRGVTLIASWPDEIKLFLPLVERNERVSCHGWYCTINELNQLQENIAESLYLIGESEHHLNNTQLAYIETDKPAQDALNGIIYHSQGSLDLKHTQYSNDFTLIDEQCTCPSCQQKFTRAYLHHLYHNTPLLCYRFLMQHNTKYLMSLVASNQATPNSCF